MTDKPRIVVKYNKNLKMSPGKLAAQAVHAVLSLYGIHPGEECAVVVLSANKGPVEAMDAFIRDAGRTEVAPGSTTAGASFDFPVTDEVGLAKLRLREATATMHRAQAARSRALEAYFEALDKE